jgi:hypothetical protein
MVESLGKYVKRDFIMVSECKILWQRNDKMVRRVFSLETGETDLKVV